jgi:hypothetical protein
VRARNAFYGTLVDIGGNGELARVLPSMHVHLVRVQFHTYRPPAENERFSDYRNIGDAVLAGDVRGAELAARKHVRRIATALAELPDRAFGHDKEPSKKNANGARLKANLDPRTDAPGTKRPRGRTAARSHA